VPQDFPSYHAALEKADQRRTVSCPTVIPIVGQNIALQDNVRTIGQDMVRTVIDGGRIAPCVVGADGATITNFTIINGTTGILVQNTRPDYYLVILSSIIKAPEFTPLISLPEINNNIITGTNGPEIFLESSRGFTYVNRPYVILENGYCGVFCAHRTEVLIRNNILTKQ